MLRRLVALVPVLVVALLSPAAPSHAADSTEAPASTCIYLVRGVKKAGGIHTGEFAVLRKAGSQVTGTFGAFYSEYVNFRGSVRGSTLRGTKTADRDGDSVVESWPANYAWVASENRIKGWKRVSRASMRTFSGGAVPLATGTCGRASVSVVGSDGFLFVNVDPNRGTGSWTFTLQVQSSSGTWEKVGMYATRGSRETRVLAVDPGTYRVVVAGRYGWSGVSSPAVDVEP